MIKVNDIRSDNEKKLKDIEPNGFFFYDDVLCRRITHCSEITMSWTLESGCDKIPVVEVAVGKIILIDRNNWVEPIADRQVFLEISD